MRRVHRLGRDERKDVLEVLVPKPALIGLGEGLIGRDLHADLTELFLKLHPETLLFGGQGADDLVRLLDLLNRGAAVDRELVNAGCHLLLEAADALHEELVENRASDGDELHTLEQGGSTVLGFVKDALDEREPGQLSVEVLLRRIEIDLVGGRLWFCDRSAGRRVSVGRGRSAHGRESVNS